MSKVTRRFGLGLLVAVFGLLAGADLAQLMDALRGNHPDPAGLLAVHGLTGGLAAMAAAGIFRRRSWAVPVVVAWGVTTAAMLWQLGPILDEPREDWRGMRQASAGIAAAALLAAWYVRGSRET